jgi:TRAP-type C4-dicarboxylate transport system permease small subunit
MTPDATHRAGDKIAHALRAIAAALLVAIVAIDAANVAGRYLLSAPISWAEEIMLFLMIGAVFLALAPVTWDGAHVRMDVLVRALPERARWMAEKLADLVSLAVTGILVYASLPIVLKLIEFDQRSHAAEVPMALPQGAVPLGFALAVIVLVARQLSTKSADRVAQHSE